MQNPSLNMFGIAISLLGGLAIFLFGMEHMTDALKVVAGSRMKSLLGRLTTNRFKGVLAGALVTGAVQSSSVTTVLLVGFVSAGLMTLQQSIGVIMGAEIGTTVTAQIIAFKVTRFAMVAVIVGFAVQFLAKREEVKHYGLMILGFGLVFFGMNLMSEATEPLRSYQPFIDLMRSMDRPLLAILMSASFTAVVQSSSATTGVIIVLASQGFLTLEAGIALVFGANIGTCVTALLAAIGKPREAVRTALVHVSFNVAGVVLWFAFIPVLADWVTLLSPSAEGLTGVARVAAETPRQIANAHTTFNVANTFIFIWFTPLIARWVTFLVPDRAVTVVDGPKPRFLDDLLLDAPALALDRVRMEIGRIADRVVEMVQRTPPAILQSSARELQSIAKMDEDVDALHSEVISYLGRLSHNDMNPKESARLHAYLSIANNFEAMADIVETNVVEVGKQAVAQEVRMSQETEAMFRELYLKVLWSVERVAQAVYAEDADSAIDVMEAKEAVGRLAERLETHLASRLAADAPGRLETFRVESSLIESLKRIYYFAKRIAKAVAANQMASIGERDSARDPTRDSARDPALA